MRRMALAIGACALVLGAAAASRSVGRGSGRAPSPDALVGLWAADTVLGPALRGTLTVERAGVGRGEWFASIGRASARAPATGDSLRLDFGGGTEFRGRLREDGRELAGYWVQPAGPVQGVPYASPLVLSRLGPRAWRGLVVPLDERFALYLDIQAAPDGSLTAVFRNPEQGERMGAPRFTVSASGDSLRFAPAGGAGRPFTAAYDAGRRRIAVLVPSISTTLWLTPRPPDAMGWLARPASAPPYVYHEPPALQDGWPVAPAGEEGFDEAALAALVRRIAAADPVADTAPAVHAFLLARHGKLVLEEYFHGFDRERRHDLRSASKTFTGIMVGAARARGVAIDTSTPVYAAFGGQVYFAHPDPRKASLTLAQLLAHTSGLACDDNDNASPGNEGTMQAQTAQPDWYRYILDLPLLHPPGEHYAYCSGGMNLAGGVLAQASGAWLPALFDTLVAVPLDLGRYYVNLMPTGQAYGGGGMHLRPRDFLKFGELYLRGGEWHGRRIVSPEWVATSVAAHAPGPPDSADGLAWHRRTLHSGGRSYREYEANGNGGQFLIVLPELDVAAVFTAGDYGRYGVWRHLRDDIVVRDVIGALVRP